MAETSSTVAFNDNKQPGLASNATKSEDNKNTYSGIDGGLSIFSPALLEQGVIREVKVDYFPLAAIQKSKPIDFYIPYTNPLYFDLSKSLISLKVKITTDDGSKVKPTDNVAFVNNVLHTLFNKVDFLINGKLVAPDVNVHFAYQQILQILAYYPVDFLHSTCACQGFAKDTSHHISKATITAAGENKGHYKRFQWTKDGNEISLIGGLGHDIAYMNCYLPNNLPVNIRFWPNADEFCLLSPTTSTELYQFKITEMHLKMHGLQVTNEIISRHEAMLANKMATFHYQRSEIKSFTVPKGQQSYSVNQLFTGELPYDVLVGFVQTSAYLGSRNNSPFDFQDFSLSHASLYIESEQEQIYSPSFRDDNLDFVHPYRNLYVTDSGTRFTPGIIELTDYNGGYTILRFKLSTTQTIRTNRVQQGTGRLTFKWEEALKESITVLVFSKFHDSIYMDKMRNIWLTKV